MGGMARKNLRMFRELCGDENLPKVRIVTTNWNLGKEQEENDREVALSNGPFKPLIEAGAKMLRHGKEEQSAINILSTLIQDEPPMTLKIQKELNDGKALAETSAGAIIIEEMMEMKKKHDKEVENLRKEIEQAVRENHEELRAELVEEERKIEELKAREEEDIKRLTMNRMAKQVRPHLLADEGQVRQGRIAAAVSEDLPDWFSWAIQTIIYILSRVFGHGRLV